MSTNLEQELQQVKQVSTDAGTVVYRNADEAIKIADYKKKEDLERKGLKRCSFGIIKHKEL